MIGVFDSGFGGLNILSHLNKQLPYYDYLYLGDNARAPYGGRSSETIYRYTKEAVDFLFDRGCQLIIIACNTASAQALRMIQQNDLAAFPGRKILGVIRPLVEAAAANEMIKRVGVIGTKATINSRAYEKELLKLNKNITVFQQSAPLLVPLIEEGEIDRPEAKMILRSYLRPLKHRSIDALLLACTHYPVMLKDIKRVMPKNCLILNPGEIVAASLSDYLSRHTELDLTRKKNGHVKILTTEKCDFFDRVSSKYLKIKFTDIEKVEL